MKAGPATWLLSDAQCNIFEEFFERVLTSTKNKGASINAVTELNNMDHESEMKMKNEIESSRTAPRESQQRRKWRNIENYTFNTRDT